MVGILLILFGIFVVFPVTLFFFLRWLAFRILKPKRDVAGMRVITPIGFVFYGCMVLVMIALCAAYQLQPAGPLGAFLHQPAGLLAAVLLLFFGSSVAEVLLRKFGTPTVRDRARRDV